MRTETLLNALLEAGSYWGCEATALAASQTAEYVKFFGKGATKHKRQALLFHAALLRRDERQRQEIAALQEQRATLSTDITAMDAQIFEKDAEIAALREALSYYADKNNWSSEAVAYDMETGGFPNVDGVTPTTDVRLELGVNIVWQLAGEGSEIARAALDALTAEPPPD